MHHHSDPARRCLSLSKQLERQLRVGEVQEENDLARAEKKATLEERFAQHETRAEFAQRALQSFQRRRSARRAHNNGRARSAREATAADKEARFWQRQADREQKGAAFEEYQAQVAETLADAYHAQNQRRTGVLHRVAHEDQARAESKMQKLSEARQQKDDAFANAAFEAKELRRARSARLHEHRAATLQSARSQLFDRLDGWEAKIDSKDQRHEHFQKVLAHRDEVFRRMDRIKMKVRMGTLSLEAAASQLARMSEQVAPDLANLSELSVADTASTSVGGACSSTSSPLSTPRAGAPGKKPLNSGTATGTSSPSKPHRNSEVVAGVEVSPDMAKTMKRIKALPGVDVIYQQGRIRVELPIRFKRAGAGPERAAEFVDPSDVDKVLAAIVGFAQITSWEMLVQRCLCESVGEATEVLERLSQAQANLVRERLIALGVPDTQISSNSVARAVKLPAKSDSVENTDAGTKYNDSLVIVFYLPGRSSSRKPKTPEEPSGRMRPAFSPSRREVGSGR